MMKTKIFETRTKTRVVVLLAGLFVFVCSVPAQSIYIYISNVDVIPIQPLDTDLITFDISGGAAQSGSQVEYSEFSQNGTSLQLDLFVDVGDATMLSTWSHLEQVGPFSTDSYNLTVCAFNYPNGTLWDTYTVDFTVVPEPTTLAIFAFALPFFRRFSRKKPIHVNS